MTAQEYAQGLRELADWLEQTGEVAESHLGKYASRGARLLMYCTDRSEFAALVSALGETATREIKSDYLQFARLFGGVQVLVYASLKSVAEQRVVGEKVEEIIEWTWLDDPALAAEVAS